MSYNKYSIFKRKAHAKWACPMCGSANTTEEVYQGRDTSWEDYRYTCHDCQSNPLAISNQWFIRDVPSFDDGRLCVLYRSCNNFKDDEAEIAAIKKAGFTFLKNRTEVKYNDLVVGRYSCWPFYKELEEDIKYNKASLLNTTEQHRYIADLQNWVADLKELTPQTWDRLQDIPDEGPFVLKGETNSRKGQWNSMCFAKNKKEAIEVYNKLSNDSLIGQQNIYIRKFEELHTYLYDIQGMPITKEFRFFVCDNQIMCGGFYWSNFTEDLGCEPPSPEEISKEFLAEAVKRIGNKARAYSLDIWVKNNGEPIVGEINDLQQSGLSDISPDIFYKSLYKILAK